MPKIDLGSTKEMDTRADFAREFYEAVFDEDERPYFVSDAATLYDIFAGEESDLVARCAKKYGIRLTENDFRVPVWKLLDSIQEREHS